MEPLQVTDLKDAWDSVLGVEIGTLLYGRSEADDHIQSWLCVGGELGTFIWGCCPELDDFIHYISPEGYNPDKHEHIMEMLKDYEFKERFPAKLYRGYPQYIMHKIILTKPKEKTDLTEYKALTNFGKY